MASKQGAHQAFPESSKFFHRARQEEAHGHHVIKETRETESEMQGEDEVDNLNQMTFMMNQSERTPMSSAGQLQPTSSKDSRGAATLSQNLSSKYIEEEINVQTPRRADLDDPHRRIQSEHQIVNPAEDPYALRGQDYDSFQSQSAYSSQFDSLTSSRHQESRSSTQQLINHKSKTLTDYTLLMLNFIPATIIQQLCTLDSQLVAQQAPRKSTSRASMSGKSQSIPKALVEAEQKLQIPLRCNVESVVLVAEFTNFYDEKKALEFNESKEFNEHLVTQSSQFLEIVSNCLTKYGGDLIQFMGYSLVAIWPGAEETIGLEGASSTTKEQMNNFLLDVSRKATQCALDAKREIQKVMGSKVKLIFGIAHGNFQVLHMGGILKRIEFFVSGSAYQQALAVMRATRKRRPGVQEHRAGFEDNIAVTPAMWSFIRDFFFGEPCASGRGGKSSLSHDQNNSNSASFVEAEFYFVHSTQTNVKLSQTNYLQKQAIEERKIQRVQIQLKSYIPAAFRHFAHIKDDRLLYAQGSHLKQTVVAMAIELNQESLECTTQHQLNLLQSIVEIIQMQVYIMEGSINRILTYEGGLIVLASWGTAFLNHHDDAPRAIYSALNIKRELIKFQQDFMVEDDTFVEPPIHIGIATGDIFQGIIGKSARKEVVSIGSAFERSFLLMQTAVKHYGKVYVDQGTKMSANHFIAFEFVEMLEFSHKILNESIYQVASDFQELDFSVKKGAKDDPQVDDVLDRKGKARYQAAQIKIHANPFFIDRDNSYQKKFSETYGRQETIHSICEDIADYIEKQADKNVWVLAIRGVEGSGKSLFARRLLLESSKREKTLLRPLLDRYEQKFHFEYVVCNCNSHTTKLFIGAWRPFLRQLLEIYAKHMRQSKEYTINSQIQFSNVDDKVDIIEAIFDLKNLARSKSQTTLTMKGNTATSLTSASAHSINALANSKHRNRQRQTTGQLGLNGERFDPDYEDSIIVFCLDFILQALEELASICCFFVIFDNASMFSVTSWKLFDCVAAQPNLLIMALCLRTEKKYFEPVDRDNLVSHLDFEIDEAEETRQYYQKQLKPREFEIFSIADMSPISKLSFKKALIDLAPVYERDINAQILDLTKILDNSNSEKSFSEQKKIALQLVNQFQGYQHFRDVQEEVMQQIVSISRGNPLTAFWFTFQAMLGKYVQIKDFVLVPTQKFRASVLLNDWSNLELPWPLFKQTQVMVQGALTDGKFSQASTTQLQMQQLLQTAAVIGDNFGMRQLDAVNKKFFDSQSQQMLPTMRLLENLERRDMIELIYDDTMLNDRFYRFTHPFTRAMIYQGMPWTWKVREIHQQIILYMKDRSTFDFTTAWSFQKEYMIMMRHVMAAERVFSEAKLSHKARQTLIVKRINQQLALTNKKNSSVMTGTFDINVEEQDSKILGVDRNPTRRLENMHVNLKRNCVEVFMRVALDSGSPKNVAKMKHALTRTAEHAYKCIAFVNLDQVTRVKELESRVVGKGQAAKVRQPRGFLLECSKWSRMDQKRQSLTNLGKASFEFVFSDEKPSHSIDDWVTALEYLRVKSTFDAFSDNYGPVKFEVPRVNQGQHATIMQKKEAKTDRNDVHFGSELAGHFQRLIQIAGQDDYALQSNLGRTTSEVSLSNEGASATGGSSAKLKRRATMHANAQLTMIASKSASQQEMKTARVQSLAKKFLVLYNVATVSFVGHMETCSLKDPVLEQNDALGLGKLSAIDRTNVSQMSHRKSVSVRRKTLAGLGDSLLNLQTQMQVLIRKNLPKNLSTMSRDMSAASMRRSTYSKQPLQFINDESDGTFTETDMSQNDTPLRQKSPNRQPLDGQGLNPSASQLNQTMTDINAEKNLFSEERYAHVGRTHLGKFVPGTQIGTTNMCLQEKFDGDLGHFKLMRRHDRVGYNEAMSPFVSINTQPMSTNASVLSLQGVSKPLMVQARSAVSLKGGYNSVHASSYTNFENPNQIKGATPVGFSIASQMNVEKLPESTRTAKGIAMSKILEGTQKPWFMLTGTDYSRPSPFQKDPSPEQLPAQMAKIKSVGFADEVVEEEKKAAHPIQMKTLSSANSLMFSSGRETAKAVDKIRKIEEPRSNQSERQALEHSFNQEELKDSAALSEKSKVSSTRSHKSSSQMQTGTNDDASFRNRGLAGQVNFQPEEGQNQISNVYKLQQSELSGESSAKSLISLIKDQNLKMQSNTQTQKPDTVATHNTHKTTQFSASDNQASFYDNNRIMANHEQGPPEKSKTSISIDRSDPSKISASESKKASNKETPALVLKNKTPFVVITDNGKTQLTADQVDFELNANDLIFIERDLPEQEGGLILTQGHCYVDNRQVTIVLPKKCYKPLPSDSMAGLTQQSWTNLPKISEETRSDYSYPPSQSNPNLQVSPSQILSSQPPPKMMVEDSAERLLLKSPTELGIAPTPSTQSVQNLSPHMQMQQAHIVNINQGFDYGKGLAPSYSYLYPQSPFTAAPPRSHTSPAASHGLTSTSEAGSSAKSLHQHMPQYQPMHQLPMTQVQGYPNQVYAQQPMQYPTPQLKVNQRKSKVLTASLKNANQPIVQAQTQAYSQARSPMNPVGSGKDGAVFSKMQKRRQQREMVYTGGVGQGIPLSDEQIYHQALQESGQFGQQAHSKGSEGSY